MIQFIAFVVGVLLKPIVFRVMALLSIGIISVTGGEQLFNSIAQIVFDQFGAMPPQLAQIAGLMNIDKLVTIVISAYVFGISYRAATGAFTKIGVR